MDHGGLNKLMILMRIWWFIHVLLDIVDVFCSITVLVMCVALHTSMMTLIGSVSVKGKVGKLNHSAVFTISMHNRLFVW